MPLTSLTVICDFHYDSIGRWDMWGKIMEMLVVRAHAALRQSLRDDQVRERGKIRFQPNMKINWTVNIFIRKYKNWSIYHCGITKGKSTALSWVHVELIPLCELTWPMMFSWLYQPYYTCPYWTFSALFLPALTEMKSTLLRCPIHVAKWRGWSLSHSLPLSLTEWLTFCQNHFLSLPGMTTCSLWDSSVSSMDFQLFLWMLWGFSSFPKECFCSPVCLWHSHEVFRRWSGHRSLSWNSSILFLLLLFFPLQSRKTWKLWNHMSHGHGHIGKHGKHPEGLRNAEGMHQYRINFNKYHPRYLGKVSMGHCYLKRNQRFCLTVNLGKL